MLLVLKFGGGEGIDLESLSKNVAKLQNSDTKIVVVVGANAELSRVQKERGIEPKMITSERGEKSRWTDEATLGLLKEVYGDTAEKVADEINKSGGTALGQIASQDNLVIAKQHGRMRIVEDGKVKVVDGDLTGSIEKVAAEKISKILDSKKILVLAPPAATEAGAEVNVDGDKIAAKVAVELKTDKLIFFANTPGLLENVADESSLIREIPIAQADEFAVGRMKKKILSAKRAIEAGVGEVIFADGRLAENPIDAALSGNGTRVF
ncbi:MAG: [LysW]-aminoadipate kinase [Candidatus Peribacteraceae bacterium]|nr:[LysW]-aminoadipate kinase [Candidatus Peribacteraceae bacterium]